MQIQEWTVCLTFKIIIFMIKWFFSELIWIVDNGIDKWMNTCAKQWFECGKKMDCQGSKKGFWLKMTEK